MQSRETKQQNEFRAMLRKAGCVEEKLHGNVFQAGLPDMLIGLPDRRVIFIEAKSTMRYSMKRGEVMGMLRPDQRRFFIQWAAFPVYVLVFSGRGAALISAHDLLDSQGWNEELQWTSTEEVLAYLLEGPAE